jgi:hypothetical protein
MYLAKGAFYINQRYFGCLGLFISKTKKKPTIRLFMVNKIVE